LLQKELIHDRENMKAKNVKGKAFTVTFIAKDKIH
jgi:hypothetical protein